MQNIEIKYKISDPGAVRERILSLKEAKFRFRHRQKDIYFNTSNGRLKIRLQEESQPCLIEYHRPDKSQSRISDYTLTPLEDYRKTRKELEAGRGILVEVQKWRELYLFRNVRIHLDEVNELGWFIEFESVISADCDEEDAAKNLKKVLTLLGDDLGEVQSTGYLDLLIQKRNNR